MTIILCWVGLISVIVFALALTILVLSAPTNMPKWFEKWSCKKGFHSFKLRQDYDFENEYPTANCLWCGKDCVSMFGKPPQKFIDLREKLLTNRESK